MAKSISEIRELSVEELTKRLAELKQESLTLRLQKATGQLENSARIRSVRRDIARVNTIITQIRTKAAN